MSEEITINTAKNLKGRHILSNEILCHFEAGQRNPIGFSHCIGIHKRCGCWIDIKNVAPKSNALVCRGCDLIVPIPATIRTWDELAAYMKEVRNEE